MGKMYSMIRIMEEKKITMAELAKQLEMNKDSLYRIRRGATPTTTTTLEAIARVLQCEVKELL